MIRWIKKIFSPRFPSRKGISFSVTGGKSNWRYRIWVDGKIILDTRTKRKYAEKMIQLMFEGEKGASAANG